MNNIVLDKTKFNYSALGAILVIMGVVIKNSLEQLKQENKTVKMAGMAFFLIGWGLTAFSVSLNDAGTFVLQYKSNICYCSQCSNSICCNEYEKCIW